MRLGLSVLGIVTSGIILACSSSAEDAIHREPLEEPQCDSATLLTTVQSEPQDLTVSETTNGQWFCVGGEPLGLDSSPQWIDAPALTDSGTLPNGAVFYLFVLPADTPIAKSLRDETGSDVPIAQTSDGDHLIIIDIDADALRFGVDEIERRWDLIGPDGEVALTLTGRGPAPGSAPTTFDDVMVCLSQNGINTDGLQPFEPAAAQAAWSACEGLNTEAMVASGLTSAQADEMEAFVRCMAEQGWLQVILATPVVNFAEHEVAALRCNSK